MGMGNHFSEVQTSTNCYKKVPLKIKIRNRHIENIAYNAPWNNEKSVR